MGLTNHTSALGSSLLFCVATFKTRHSSKMRHPLPASILIWGNHPLYPKTPLAVAVEVFGNWPKNTCQRWDWARRGVWPLVLGKWCSETEQLYHCVVLSWFVWMVHDLCLVLALTASETNSDNVHDFRQRWLLADSSFNRIMCHKPPVLLMFLRTLRFACSCNLALFALPSTYLPWLASSYPNLCNPCSRHRQAPHREGGSLCGGQVVCGCMCGWGGRERSVGVWVSGEAGLWVWG